MMNPHVKPLKKALGIERLSWRFIALSFTLLMASSWMADFLSEIMIKLWDDPKDIVTSLRHYSLHLLISFSALIIAYHWAKNAWEESFEVRTVAPYPKAGICFLSSKSINHPYNPWEMNAYFVAHYPSMAYLLVITSAGDDGSFHQYDAFVSEIKLAHPNLILIHYAQHYHSTGENFIHLPALKTVCKNAYQLLANMYQCDDSDIVFDATSGTKECSIAATISTLKDGRYLHYTNKHKQGTTFDIHE